MNFKKVKSLILKDVLQSKTYFLSNTIMCIIFCAVFLFTFVSVVFDQKVVDEVGKIGAFQTALFSSFYYFCIYAIYTSNGVANAYQQDEKCNFDKFAISSGIDRKLMVFEKLIFGIVCAIPGLLITLICSIFMIVTSMEFLSPLIGIYVFVISLSANFISIAISVVLNSFLGSVKGRVWSTVALALLLFAVECGVFALLTNYVTNILYTSLITFGYLIISIIVLICGYFLSKKAYLNKEF